tara:strand:- start:1847 stop:2017 length:171 start_codon:yes stop_codon:yes gene_type:complete
MARQPEYDGYLAVDDELVKETFRVQEENIRVANQKIEDLEQAIADLANRIVVLESA